MPDEIETSALPPLTESQRAEIGDGIESEGFDYYFTKYTHKWCDEPTEIQPFAIAHRDATSNLEKVLKKSGVEL